MAAIPFKIRNAAAFVWLVSHACVSAQKVSSPKASVSGDDSDIVVIGARGQLGDEQPVLRLGEQAIRGLGARSIADLLRALGPVARSANGSEPIFALDSRRPVDDAELFSLPPEAFVQIDILPESAAARLGYPPTRRVLNFTTKAKFASREIGTEVSRPTAGGLFGGNTNLGTTRIRDRTRFSLNGTFALRGALRQRNRAIAGNLDDPLALVGEDTASNYGSTDLTQRGTARFPDKDSEIPDDPDQHCKIVKALISANELRMSDLGDFRDLLGSEESIRANSVIGRPLGETASMSLSLSIDHVRTKARAGPASVRSTTLSTYPGIPLNEDDLLARYSSRSSSLRVTSSTNTIRASGGARGYIAGWTWLFSADLTRQDRRSKSEVEIQRTSVDIATVKLAGPLVEIDPDIVQRRDMIRSSATTKTGNLQGVVDGMLFALPAGPTTLTTTFEFQRSSVQSQSFGALNNNVGFERTQAKLGLSVSLPIAAKSADVLPFLGSLTANARAGVAVVSRYDRLYKVGLGITWTPLARVQLLADFNTMQTAPTLDLLGGPAVVTPGVPFFDQTLGVSRMVTTITGGNAGLKRERRARLSLSANFQPFARREWRFGLSYEAIGVQNPIGYLAAATSSIETAFPGRFVRDAAGELASVDLRPVNLKRSVQRSMSSSISFAGAIGREPPQANPETAPPSERPTYFVTLSPTLRITDKTKLGEGLPALNLLGGDVLGSASGRPRFELQQAGSLNYRGLGLSVLAQWQAPTRVRDPLPAADLHFSALGKIRVEAFALLDVRFPQARWARGARLGLSIDNLLNERQDVRNREGRVPYSFQPAFLDPIGRNIFLNMRKLF